MTCTRLAPLGAAGLGHHLGGLFDYVVARADSRVTRRERSECRETSGSERSE